MNEFFTWETLSTLAGATVGVMLLTEFVKWLLGSKARGWVLHAISFLAALFILYGASFFSGRLDASNVALTFLNAVMVTMAANGLFDNIKALKSRNE